MPEEPVERILLPADTAASITLSENQIAIIPLSADQSAENMFHLIQHYWSPYLNNVYPYKCAVTEESLEIWCRYSQVHFVMPLDNPLYTISHGALYNKDKKRLFSYFKNAQKRYPSHLLVADSVRNIHCQFTSICCYLPEDVPEPNPFPDAINIGILAESGNIYYFPDRQCGADFDVYGCTLLNALHDTGTPRELNKKLHWVKYLIALYRWRERQDEKSHAWLQKNYAGAAAYLVFCHDAVNFDWMLSSGLLNYGQLEAVCRVLTSRYNSVSAAHWFFLHLLRNHLNAETRPFLAERAPDEAECMIDSDNIGGIREVLDASLLTNAARDALIEYALSWGKAEIPLIFINDKYEKDGYTDPAAHLQL